MDRTYEIFDENWNPNGMEHWTEEEIFSCADSFEIAHDRILIDYWGGVYCDGTKIGEAD